MDEFDARRLVDEFADAIMKQNDAIESGTTKDVRRYGRRITPLAKRIVRMGEEGIRQFATLLHHPERSVRGCAGVYLFSSMPREVLEMFSEMARGDDLRARAAQRRIIEWEEHPEHYDISNWV